jgi:putative transposase
MRSSDRQSRLCDSRACLRIVRPETVIRWHRTGWRLFWRHKTRSGRPRIPFELRQLIWRMANENPMWGQERIANEMLPKLGLRVSPRTVRKYMPKPVPGRPRGDQRWATFLRNHAKAIIACDFLVAVTATFRLAYVFVVIITRLTPIAAFQRHSSPHGRLDAAAATGDDRV